MGKYERRHRQDSAEDTANIAQDGLTQESEAPGSSVTEEQLREDDTNPDSWLQYNKGLRQLGYSPAERITRENVDSLSQEYTLDTKGAQLNPIVVPSGDDEPPVMYFPEGQAVRAVNARTGETYWELEYEAEYGAAGRKRGVAVRGDTLYFVGGDLNLLALDRYTGEEQWRTYCVSERQREEMEPSTERVTHTGAPIVFDGTVYVGQSGERGNWGAVVAVDAESGDIAWDYDVIPKDHWVEETWRYGDGAPWMNTTIDPESETVFVTTGNPSPQINGAVRPGPNKHSDSVIALDANSGEVNWTHQLVAHDWWDYDTYLTRVFDADIDGETTRVVQAEDKTGWIYVIDVETGQLLRRSEPHANQGAELEFMQIPPAGEENAMEKSPSAIGGTDWHPDSYSPETGLVYIASIDDYRGSWYDPDWTYVADEIDHDIGGGKEFLEDPNSGEKGGRASAIDPETGEVVWATPYEGEGAQTFAGGNTSTGGNLVFGGNAGGWLRALDAENGDVLWEEQLNEGFRASPVVWDDPGNGTQYVAVASASTLFVYSLEAEMQDDEESSDGSGDETGNSSDGGNSTNGDNGTDDGNSTDGGGGVNESGSGGDDSVPGFGAAAGAAGVGAGAAAAKRFGGDDGDDEDDG